ncbi:MAG: GNAT family N-acetyltransferase [Anaerolineae bacterium]|nr:GNAT family N-acetyltransferase [Anaerolineae bacterium]
MTYHTMDLKIEAFHTEEAFSRLRDEWNPLLESSPRNRLFMTWEWQSTWWAAYHPGELWIITVRDSQNTLIGLAPWFIHPHPKGRLVRSIGCVEVTDYLELIIRPGCEYEVLRALTEHALTQKDRYDSLDFCNIPVDSPVLQVWPHLLESAGYELHIDQQEVCPHIPLPDSWDEYLQTLLDKKNRHELRRKLRRAGTVEIHWEYLDVANHPEEAQQRFLALMRASNPDKALFLDDPENTDFFQRMIPVIAEKGWLQISLLQINGEDAATYLSFDYGNKILLYNSGINPKISAEVSPGIVLLTYIIRDAIEKGRDEFDFLRGNEEYKYRLGGQDRPVMMLNARLK